MCQEAYLLLKTIAKNFVLRCVFRISDEEWLSRKTRLSCVDSGWCCLWLPSRFCLGLIRPDYNKVTKRQNTAGTCVFMTFVWDDESSEKLMLILAGWDILTWILTLSIFEWMFLKIQKIMGFFMPLDYQMDINGCGGEEWVFDIY